MDDEQMRWLRLVTLVLAACGHSSHAHLADAPPPDAVSADGPVMEGDPFTSIANLPPVCLSDRWCWLWPTPSGSFYSYITSTAPDNIWITGGGVESFSPIMQWNGQQWITHTPPVPPGYPPYLYPMGLSTTGPNNTWMAYNDVVEHWDGTSWTIVNHPPGYGLNGIYATPLGNAWVTDNQGNVTLWTPGGVAVKTLPSGTDVGAVWGTAEDDFFVTTIGGILHSNGNSLDYVYQGGKTASSYQGAKQDVWISGNQGVILHWNGSFITEIPTGLSSEALVRSAEYAADNDITWIQNGPGGSPANFLHWDGTQVTATPVDPASQVTPLGDTRCTDLGGAQIIAGKWWIVCRGGAVMTVAGTGLVPVIEPMVAMDMWGTSMTDLYVSTGSELHHWDGATWTRDMRPVEVLAGIPGAGVGSANELFGAHSDFDGSTYTYTTYVDHFDGAAWTSLPVTKFPLSGPLEFIAKVYPLNPGEAMIIAGQGNAYHYTNGTLTPIATGTTNDLVGVWGPDPDHLSITGSNATLLQWDRTNPTVFKPDPSGPATTDNLRDITSVGGKTWILAQNQTYVWMKPAGGAWVQVDAKTSPNNIVARSATDVLVNGNDSGSVSHWNGTAFVRELYPSGMGLLNTFALPDGTTFLYGLDGVVFRPPAGQ
jgi:hypothetical protein